MDALSFVLCVQTKQMRSANMKELIHRKTVESADDEAYLFRKCSVEMHFNQQLKDGSQEKIIFGRVVRHDRKSGGSTTDHKVNGTKVTYVEYQQVRSFLY